jgi:prepilin-type N-terminal cleavage/methylation domain-containing protein
MHGQTGKRRKRRRQGGFTMIEVMIASLLTAIAMSGIVGLYMVQMRSSGYSRHNTEATILAEDKMEALRTQTIPVSGTETLNEPGGVPNLFERRWSVAPQANWIDYNVTVSWLEEGALRSITVSSRRGL